MNITNQINAGLNDVRASLVAMSKLPPGREREQLDEKAQYQLDLIVFMVLEHVNGVKSVPWSDRKHQVEEEFS